MNNVVKKITVLLLLFSLIPFDANAKSEEKLVAELPEANLALYATYEVGSDLSHFKLQYKGGTYFFPRWFNSPIPTWYPKIFYNDINNDGKKDVVIVLTTGSGSDINIQEVHVFHENSEGYLNEVLVDNPLAIINKNIKTKLSKSEALITIANKNYKIDVRELKIDPSHKYENVAYGSYIQFEIINNKLVAKVLAAISFVGGGLGQIEITYTFKDNMYQAEQINFIP